VGHKTGDGGLGGVGENCKFSAMLAATVKTIIRMMQFHSVYATVSLLSVQYALSTFTNHTQDQQLINIHILS